MISIVKKSIFIETFVVKKCNFEKVLFWYRSTLCAVIRGYSRRHYENKNNDRKNKFNKTYCTDLQIYYIPLEKMNVSMLRTIVFACNTQLFNNISNKTKLFELFFIRLWYNIKFSINRKKILRVWSGYNGIKISRVIVWQNRFSADVLHRSGWNFTLLNGCTSAQLVTVGCYATLKLKLVLITFNSHMKALLIRYHFAHS